MPYIGIDFGTSNSVVANFQYGQAEVIPNHEGQNGRRPSSPSAATVRSRSVVEAKENFDEQRSIRSIKRIPARRNACRSWPNLPASVPNRSR